MIWFFLVHTPAEGVERALGLQGARRLIWDPRARCHWCQSGSLGIPAFYLSSGTVRLTETTDVWEQWIAYLTGIVVVLVGGEAVTRRQNLWDSKKGFCGILLVNILVLLGCGSLWRNRTGELTIQSLFSLKKTIWRQFECSTLLGQMPVEVTARSKVKFQVDVNMSVERLWRSKAQFWISIWGCWLLPCKN